MDMQCKILNNMEVGFGMGLVLEAHKRGQTLCTTCNLDFAECPKSTRVTVGLAGYTRVKTDEKLPTQKAWCRDCSKESSKPIAYVRLNGRTGIVVECECCHSRYILYENMYIERYVGRHTEYGFIPPTHGQNNSIPRNVKMKMDAARERRRQESKEHLALLFGYSSSEYDAKRKEWNAKREAEYKKFLKEEEERINSRKQQDAVNKSKTKSQLIKEGIIKYDSKAKCLVNTKTGEVINL